MNQISRILSLLLITGLVGAGTGYAQSNPNANPVSLGITTPSGSLRVGQSALVTMQLGNNGSQAIPVNGATWFVSFPNTVTVNQASLTLGGGSFTPSWTVNGGGTVLTLNLSGAGIPARVFNGPQTIFSMTVSVTGATVGGPLQFTLTNINAPAVAGNSNTGDDNASSPITITAAALPVKLVDFTATAKGCVSALRWHTASEQNASHYEVEVSENGADFNRAGIVKAKGTTSLEQHYSFDYRMKSGTNWFFRLKMVDLDGSFAYSAVQKAACNDLSTGVVIAPNPVVSAVNISGMDMGTNMITIQDVKGKQVQRLSVSGRETTIDCSSYAPGIYNIHIENEQGNVISRKLVKQ